MLENNSLHYMSLAVQLAMKGRYTVSPNPMVGCIIVKNNLIIGQGWHQKAGEAHAEVMALKEAGDEAMGASAYVTLEPCCHYGRTPPCTKTLINAGIKEVFVACKDPNPLVSGEGINELISAGVKVSVGTLEAEALQLNKIFFHFIKNKRPFVISKWAMSLDGKTIAQSSDSKQISSNEANLKTHDLRQSVDAVLIGARTAILDNPELTVRYSDNSLNILKQPKRIVLTSKALFPLNLKLFNDAYVKNTIVVATEDIDKEMLKFFNKQNIELIIMPKTKEGTVSLPDLLDELGKRNMSSLLVEGGMTTHHQFFKENLVNEIQVFLSPVLIGGHEHKRKVSNLNVSHIGCDFSFLADY